MKTIPLDPESQRIELVGKPGWTPAHEVKWLCWLAGQVQGDVLEIGCNNGQTTRELAVTNPVKLIYGVDYVSEEMTMVAEQRGERPGIIGEVALNLANVQVSNQNSRMIDYRRQFPGLGMIFIDGDHSYEGVKADTINALRAFDQPNVGRRAIVWHDCYPEAPEWCGVWKYLNGLTERGYGISRVDGTWLAVMFIPAGMIAPQVDWRENRQ